MSVAVYLTLDEVIERYRNQISEGTLRNWRSKRFIPPFIHIGKAVLYPALAKRVAANGPEQCFQRGTFAICILP
ncbi:hypothetical protein GCM10011491_08070 [Brucella endophytica]|uniref:DNA-binding protein n=1 Tax=Brucella endophytica TaxID=1963359 RepID=A0A916WBI4_9HYPH|nr:DNA-binding protein [Brucella endophytica]GGA83014.1 hypothetical protein GCM10011491_08070 [Brucella endophytica]